MLLYQRLTFFSINGVVLAWLLKVLVADDSSDSVGLFAVFVVIFLLLYAFYFAIIVRYGHLGKPETRAGKVKFLLLAALPFFALWGLTAF